MSDSVEENTDNGPLDPRELERALKACLNPLRNDSDTWGCLSALLVFGGSTVLLARVLISPWLWGTAALVLGVVLLVVWSTRDDRRKRRLIDQCSRCLEEGALLNAANREDTLAEIRQMAANDKHSYKAAAETMLNEMNEALTPAEGPERAVEQAVQVLDSRSKGTDEVIVSRGADRGVRRPQRQKGGWNRNRQIPLEPEDHEDP